MQKRNSAKYTCVRQRVLQSFERINGRGEWKLSAGAATSAPTNTAKRAIQTFKNHFIAGIVLTHKDSPLHLWCCILHHAIVTLNLLSPSRINDTLSAHAQLHGQFDFNATLFAPSGTKVIVHQNPTMRQSWAPPGKDELYKDRAKDHYRCYNINVPETQEVIQPYTVDFLLHNSNIPLRSSTENTTIAATELIHALCNPAPAAPYAHIGDALYQVSFNC